MTKFLMLMTIFGSFVFSNNAALAGTNLCKKMYKECLEEGGEKLQCRKKRVACRKDELGMTCEEIYRHRYGFSYTRDKSWDAIGYIALSILMPPLAPIFIVSAIASALFKPKHRTAKLEKVEAKFDKLAKKYSKTVEENFVEDNGASLYIGKAFMKGLESGKFCENYPRLYGRAKMKRYIRDVLFEEYGVDTNSNLEVTRISRHGEGEIVEPEDVIVVPYGSKKSHQE